MKTTQTKLPIDDVIADVVDRIREYQDFLRDLRKFRDEQVPHGTKTSSRGDAKGAANRVDLTVRANQQTKNQ